MSSYKAPLRDMQFLLQDVFCAAQLFASMKGTSEMTSDVSDAVLEEAARICETLLGPLNQPGDEIGCRHENGRVITPPGFVEAYKAFAQGGWVGFIGDPKFGGQGMPKMLSVLLEEMLMGSNPSFGLYPILTSGASLALSLHGTTELKQAYLPNLYSGRWSATMCLTEAHAGSDLGIIRTRAVPHQDGSFRLTGTKIFITAGEHDLTDNIIHFVLAKLPDAPAGSRGISLFLVPRKLDVNGMGAAIDNGVSCASIEHKMGLKASATCVMNFENSKCFLVGEINKGLACMFTMMNYERLSMGLQGIGLAQNSYHSAVRYARERLQGRAPEGTLYPGQIADPIIVHPDVRRMLLTMRANIIAGRALSLYVASKLDIAKFHANEAERLKASELVELLTPVAKAYLTDRGFEACVIGQQVFGGHGYIREWGVEQLVRDARIAQIYEGTNGIQALDLAGRKTVRSGGYLLQQLEGEIAGFIEGISGRGALQPHLDRFQRSMDLLRECTDFMIHRASGNNSETGAAAYPYMELLGLNCFAFMWVRILATLQGQEICARYEPEYLDSLRKTADFFMLKLLPRGRSLAEEIKSGSDVIMGMTAEQF